MDNAQHTRHAENLLLRVLQLRHASSLHVFLDYDGTLVPFAPAPELAGPDQDLIALLAQLAFRPHTQVHLLSGRDRFCMERWFGDLPIVLHAEDGYWSRLSHGGAWIAAQIRGLEWKQSVAEILADLTQRTDGSLMERKTNSIAWHYRKSDPRLAIARLDEARHRLEAVARRGALELIDGPMVLEVRRSGIEKRRIVSMLRPTLGSVLAAGDDAGDEGLFEVLPPNAVAIHVGSGQTCARYTVSTPAALRRALHVLVRGTA